MTKNERIKQSIAETKARRLTQRCFVIDLKIKTNKLNKLDQDKLKMYFVQCKWLYNYMLSLPKIDDYKTTEKQIKMINKDGELVDRYLTIPAKIIQDVQKNLKQSIKVLAHRKAKGYKIGKLKFKSDYNSINLNQYNSTHYITEDGIKILGFKKIIKVFGLDQLKDKNFEYANAKLIKKPSGYYIKLTCYKNLKAEDMKIDSAKKSVGLDFGIKTTLTTSENEKFNILIGESDRLKNLQRKLSRQKKGSNNWCKTKLKLDIEYERLTNKKKDKCNKLISYLCSNYSFVYMQDEMISKWHKEKLLGKKVQHSCLGMLKAKLKKQKNVFLISKEYPTTKFCYKCGTLHKDITLKDRTFICPTCGFSEDRDVKAAKTILFIGQCLNSYSTTEHSTAIVEKVQDLLAETNKQLSMKQEVHASLDRE